MNNEKIAVQRQYLLFLWLILLVLFAGCSADNPAAIPNVAPAAYAGANQEVSSGAVVTLDGSGSSDYNSDVLSYSWTLSAKPAGSTAILSGPTSVTPSFTADQPGTYIASLTVNDGALNSKADTVTITAVAAPVNSAPVAFAGTDQSGSMGRTITLDGTGSYDPEHDPLTYSWIFQTKPAGSNAILANADTSMPTFVPDSPGTYIVGLIVNDGAVNSPVDTTTITAIASPCGTMPPMAQAGADRIVPVGSLVTLDGSASIEPCGYSLTYTWSVVSAPSGSIPSLSDPQAQKPLFAAGLEGKYTFSLLVSNGTETSVADTVTITAATIANFTFRVVDAEYSKQLDKIVMVASMPANQLHIYDPVTGNDQTVDLNLTPTSVSVGPDGTHAAVGHNGWVSYVDLTTATLVKVLAVTTDVIDVVLAGNGYIYAFPRIDQWEYIRCLKIDTGAETLGGGGSIYAGTKAKLHPGGLAIYGADNGLSPADIEKYDISSGTAAMLYDSPYHGDFAMCGDLWMSEDGLRIFTRCGNVFRASPNRYSSGTTPEDMTYNGALQNLTMVRHLSHSSSAAMVAAIPDIMTTANDDAQVRLFNYEFLTFNTGLQLPKFTFNNTEYVGHGRFVFYNSAGTRLYIIMMADPSAGALYDYGLFVY